VEQAKLKLERSIATNREMKKGEAIQEADLHLLSPGDGYKWVELNQVIGKILNQDVPKDEIIYSNMFL
jgi:sialic acid synthase